VWIATAGGTNRRNEIALDGLPGAYFLLTNMLQGAYWAMLLKPPHEVSRRVLLDNLTVFVLRMLREERVLNNA
jgi:hypothetical protein